MPVLGWLGGASLASSIGVYDHWIAFLLLALIGGKMIVEAVRGGGGWGAVCRREHGNLPRARRRHQHRRARCRRHLCRA
ncbi:manganese efflux pump [Methanoculleus bourgensis]|nr:manganese efflux pump [Methanoculleus bourgensis]